MYEEILGGLSKDFKHETKEQYVGGYSVGNNALFHMKNNIMDWKLLNNILSSRSVKNDTRVIQSVNDILNLTEYVDNPKILCLIIKEIYNLSDKDLIKVLTKSLNIDEALKNSLRKLYMVWYDLIEYMLNILMQTLEIQATPDLEILPNLHNINLSKLPDKLRKKFGKYEHRGYCPCEPIVRILALFKFPIGDLISSLKSLNKKLFIGIDFLDTYKEIYSLVEEIEIIRNTTIPEISKRRPLEHPTKDNYPALLKTYTDKFIELYKNVYPAMIYKEEQYIEISKKIYRMCDIIANLIKLL